MTLLSVDFCLLKTGEPVGEAVDLTIIFDTLVTGLISLLVEVNDFTDVVPASDLIMFKLVGLDAEGLSATVLFLTLAGGDVRRFELSRITILDVSKELDLA